MDISEVVRRWQAGGSRRRIASGTGLSRETVGKYIALAEGMGVSREGPTPTEEQLGRRSTGLCPPRTDWLPGPTRSTSGSPAAACSSPEFRSCWRSGVAQYRMPRCTGSSPAATGGAGAAARSGWRTPPPARWRSWTSAVWAWSTTRKQAAAGRCGRWSWCWVTPGTASSGSPSARSWSVNGTEKLGHWGGARVCQRRSLASVNVRASCSGKVSQRQAGSRQGG